MPTAPAPFITFRDTLRAISPRWLRRGFAEKYLYALVGLPADALADWAALGVRRRFPNLDSDDTLNRIGKDRVIRRGRSEDAPTYASRLQRWLDDHRHRGGPYALLAQLHAHYAAAPFVITLEYPSGLKFTMATDGAITWDFSGTWPPGTTGWAQWLLTYAWPNTLPPENTWGGGTLWGDGSVWGSGLSPGEVEDLLLIPAEWNAAHTKGLLWLQDGFGTINRFSVP